MKRIFSILFLVTLQLSLFSDICDNSIPVTLPCLASKFLIEANALYVKPSSCNLDYAVLTNSIPSSPNWRSKSVDPEYTWTFDLGVGYVFPNTANDLRINWVHFKTEDHDHLRISNDDDDVDFAQYTAPFFAVGPEGNPYSFAKGKVNDHFDNVYLVGGQYIDLGNCLRLHLVGGLAYAHIKQTLTNFYSNTLGDVNLTTHQVSRFNGGGPVIGLDVLYQLGFGFSLSTSLKAALYTGSLKRNLHYTTVSPTAILDGAPYPNFQELKGNSKTQIVPSFDGKFGLHVTYEFCDCNVIEAEIGYRAAVFIDPIQGVVGSSLVDLNNQGIPGTLSPGSGIVDLDTVKTVTSNFGYSGPYLTIVFLF